MAAAALSSLATPVEKTNGAKLSSLLIDGGTTVLRNVFDSYHPPANLAASLSAKYVILANLFKRNVLHKSQWDLLFPPGGATPDSNTFDITLLFLLLTNICGLSPPLSGWHKPPPSSDTSLEANLTRMKLYRNELYGHVTSTGVQTAVFNVKWQEISTVLVALGLNPTEVVRLKSAPCGEDYISAVIEWAKSDEEIKSQLRELRKRQHEARQIQEEDHNTLQDTHEVVKEVLKTLNETHQMQHEHHRTIQVTQQAVEGVRQINQDTHQVVKEVLKTQQEARQIQHEDHSTLQDTQQTVEDVRQINQDAHQVVKEVLKTQQEAHQIQHEDHSTLQETRQKVEDLWQINQDTHQVVKEVLKTHQEVHLKQHDTAEKLRQTQQEDREMLQELHQTQSKTQQIVQGVVKTEEEHFETLRREVKQAVDILKEGRDGGGEDQVLQNLAKSEFKGDIEYLVGRYQEGTREWVFNEVENWLDNRNSENRVMVISSNAGMGKSVISAVICKRMQEADRLSGSHFCQYNNARYRNPQLMLQSLACHLYHALPEYKQGLVKQLSRNVGKDINNMGVEELFALLFKEPLSAVADPGKNMLMVIDGLDESEIQERNELLDVVANHLCKLPCWIRFLCTTRPEKNIAEALKHLKPFQLETNDDKNIEDIKCFIENRTQHLIKPEKRGAIVEKLVEKSEGLMLYAYFLVLFIEENKSVVDQGNLDDSLPLAISSAYHSFFKRLEKELKKEVRVNEEDFLSLLSAVIASREPIPIDFVSKLLGPNASSPLARRKVLKAISSVSSLLPIRDGCLYVIHKSVKDWLTDASCYGEHDFTMDEKDGHRILASLCADELDHLKQKGIRDAQFSATEKYALHHGVRHMLQLEENVGSQSLEECLRTYVTDLELFYGKICVNSSIAAEEILWFQSQKLFQTLSANTRDLLNMLVVLLRKHLSTFTDHPYLVFQTLLNEGGPVLSPMASDILQHKYPEIPYLEFVNKRTQQGAVLARFQCSSKVVCFDISPQSNFMVCECMNGTIQLWSLRTGELLWTRPVKEEKCYGYSFRLGCEYTTSLFFSGVMALYRSVVFHPTEKVVLPGVLSHAYDFNGDLKPFFPESHCSFTVCSISGDKTTILTDCPDDGKCIIMWSLKNGLEISRITREEDILSFAWSRDGKMLAISHASGRIAIVDVVDGFRTLGQTDLRSACGMIRFSPDSRSLLCFHISSLATLMYCLNINIAEHLTCRVDFLEEPCVTWEFESRSEAGFLSGDPPPRLLEGKVGWLLSDLNFEFMLDGHTVLRSDDDRVEMLNITERHQSKKEVAHITVPSVLFSLSSETIYVASVHYRSPATTVTAWNVSRSELIAEKIFDFFLSSCTCLLALKGGVLITTRMGTLQMWNFDLSKCVRCWTNVGSVTRVVPISDERVACRTKEGKVIVFDTTSEEILSTIQIGHTSDLLACNTKFQILTRDNDGSLRLSDQKTTLWETGCHDTNSERFSPEETFVISCDKTASGARVVVLDAVSGNTLHVLCNPGRPFARECDFVSDGECVVLSEDIHVKQWFVQLFNVKSGDLLSNLALSYRLPRMPLSTRGAIAALHVSVLSPFIKVTLNMDTNLSKFDCLEMKTSGRANGKL